MTKRYLLCHHSTAMSRGAKKKKEAILGHRNSCAWLVGSHKSRRCIIQVGSGGETERPGNVRLQWGRTKGDAETTWAAVISILAPRLVLSATPLSLLHFPFLPCAHVPSFFSPFFCAYSHLTPFLFASRFFFSFIRAFCCLYCTAKCNSTLKGFL